MWYDDVVRRGGTTRWYDEVVRRGGTMTWYDDHRDVVLLALFAVEGLETCDDS